MRQCTSVTDRRTDGPRIGCRAAAAAVLLAVESSRAMLASARLSCFLKPANMASNPPASSVSFLGRGGGLKGLYARRATLSLGFATHLLAVIRICTDNDMTTALA